MKRFLTLICAVLAVLGLTYSISFNSKLDSAKQEIKGLTAKNKRLQVENEQKTKKLKAIKENTSENVKQAAEQFTKAFFTYDTGKGETFMSNISKYTTPKAQEMLKPAGDTEQGKPVPKERAVRSGVDKQIMYYSPMSEEKANVLARVYQRISINEIDSTHEVLMDLTLIYDGKRWIVDEAKMLTQLADERINYSKIEEEQ